MREAGYLTAMYENVYLDIGEVFPVVSRGGQEAVMQQVLELAPTNKIMWSSELFFSLQWNGNVEGAWTPTGDGHWWPETYYLGSFQARRALSSVRICVPDLSCWSRWGHTERGCQSFRCCKTLSKQRNLQRKRRQGSPKTSYFIQQIGFTASCWSRSCPLPRD